MIIGQFISTLCPQILGDQHSTTAEFSTNLTSAFEIKLELKFTFTTVVTYFEIVFFSGFLPQ